MNTVKWPLKGSLRLRLEAEGAGFWKVSNCFHPGTPWSMWKHCFLEWPMPLFPKRLWWKICFLCFLCFFLAMLFVWRFDVLYFLDVCCVLDVLDVWTCNLFCFWLIPCWFLFGTSPGEESQYTKLAFSRCRPSWTKTGCLSTVFSSCWTNPASLLGLNMLESDNWCIFAILTEEILHDVSPCRLQDVLTGAGWTG